MKRKLLQVLLLAFFATPIFAQDVSYARKVVDTLTSSYFWGRGYTNDGMKKAADYLAAEFTSLGLKPMDNRSYQQPFTYSANTFPGKIELTVNGQQLQPGKDFLVAPQSKAFNGLANLQRVDEKQFVDGAQRLIIALEEKLTWSVSQEVQDYTIIILKKAVIDGEPKTAVLKLDQRFQKKFQAANVCGLVKGTVKPDSVIVFTAHYDHLGGMGEKTYFPGANDNASGVALLLNLAKYYAANPQPYTIAFIAFAGEEAGLVGSKYFTENSPIPLKSIRFLMNVDLVGTGDDGATIVNATEFKKEFELLNQVNDAVKFLVKINARGKAANSDHYWFTEKGVPSFFLYTLGGISAYHDILDKGETLPLNELTDLVGLMKGFISGLMR